MNEKTFCGVIRDSTEKKMTQRNLLWSGQRVYQTNVRERDHQKKITEPNVCVTGMKLIITLCRHVYMNRVEYRVVLAFSWMDNLNKKTREKKTQGQTHLKSAFHAYLLHCYMNMCQDGYQKKLRGALS